MDIEGSRSHKWLAAALIVIVLTQAAYMTVKGDVITGGMIWGLEAIAFLAITLLAAIPLSRQIDTSLAWGAISVFGLLNLMQVGIGLTMFAPLTDAGESAAPVFTAVLAFAFFLYLAAKVAMGVAAVHLGLIGFAGGSAGIKTVGVVAVISGLAAIAANGAAMVLGRDGLLTFAGASGTLATLAVAVLILSGRHSSVPRAGYITPS